MLLRQRERLKWKKTFNLGSGKNYSVREIYDLIAELLGKKGEPVLKKELPGEAETTLADISAAKAVEWNPKTDIKTGLIKAIDYIRNEIAEGRL